MCHIQVQEYLDSFKQREIASKGSGTLVGQNLRDALLSHHMNLKTKTQWFTCTMVFCAINTIFTWLNAAPQIIVAFK